MRQSNLDVINNIAFFHGQDEALVAGMITALKPLFQVSGEVLCYQVQLQKSVSARFAVGRAITLTCTLLWFSQGHVGKEMYFLLKGHVEALVRDLAAHPVLVGLYLEGSYFGDVALLLNRRRPMTIRAVSNCDMFSVSKVRAHRRRRRHVLLLCSLQVSGP